MITQMCRIEDIFDYETDFVTNLSTIMVRVNKKRVVVCQVDSILFWNNWHSVEDEQIDLLITTVIDCVANFAELDLHR